MDLSGGGGNCDIPQRFSLFPVEALQFSPFSPNLMTPNIEDRVSAVLPAKDETKVGLNPLALPPLGPSPCGDLGQVLLLRSDVIVMSRPKVGFPDTHLMEKPGKENIDIFRQNHLDSK